MPATSLATLRSNIEAHLHGRVASPFAYRQCNVFHLVSTGVPQVDALTGGLPRGAMTEICGAPSSGRTSLLLAALASRTADGEVCALVDARDSFDPLTAAASGIALKKLLWVRCQNIDQALRATDLLIQAGGFGMVAIDLSDVPAKIVRQVPLNAWFRFRRAVEDTPTILLLLEQEANAKTCASLVMRLEAEEAKWTQVAQALLPVPPATTPRPSCSPLTHPVAQLLKGFAARAEVLRSRIQIPEKHIIDIRAGTQSRAHRNVFETETIWSK
ncbi:MAG TPA: hypothetical protein VKQ28_04460 [Candidatus Acidoferrum sp.]|nr:hypothetical protein [Candidatus Acidoferrum sp.]